MIDEHALVGRHLQVAALAPRPGLHALVAVDALALVGESAPPALLRAVGGVSVLVAAAGVVEAAAAHPGVGQRLGGDLAPRCAPAEGGDLEEGEAGHLAAAVHHHGVVARRADEVLAAPGRGPGPRAAAVGDQGVAVGVELEAELVHVVVAPGAAAAVEDQVAGLGGPVGAHHVEPGVGEGARGPRRGCAIGAEGLDVAQVGPPRDLHAELDQSAAPLGEVLGILGGVVVVDRGIAAVGLHHVRGEVEDAVHLLAEPRRQLDLAPLAPLQDAGEALVGEVAQLDVGAVRVEVVVQQGPEPLQPGSGPAA